MLTGAPQDGGHRRDAHASDGERRVDFELGLDADGFARGKHVLFGKAVVRGFEEPLSERFVGAVEKAHFKERKNLRTVGRVRDFDANAPGRLRLGQFAADFKGPHVAPGKARAGKRAADVFIDAPERRELPKNRIVKVEGARRERSRKADEAEEREEGAALSGLFLGGRRSHGDRGFGRFAGVKIREILGDLRHLRLFLFFGRAPRRHDAGERIVVDLHGFRPREDEGVAALAAAKRFGGFVGTLPEGPAGGAANDSGHMASSKEKSAPSTVGGGGTLLVL